MYLNSFSFSIIGPQVKELFEVNLASVNWSCELSEVESVEESVLELSVEELEDEDCELTTLELLFPPPPPPPQERTSSVTAR